MVQRVWVCNPPKPKNIPPIVLSAIESAVEPLLVEWRKKLPEKPKEKDWNYIIDIQCKSYKRFFTLYERLRCPSPRALSPTFDEPFARIEYLEDGRFNLEYFRHTKEWWTLEYGVSLPRCIGRIQSDVLLQPHLRSIED